MIHRRTVEPERYIEGIERLKRGLHIAEFDQAAAIEFGKIQSELQDVGRATGRFDALLAAVARSGDYIIVTDNIRHFRDINNLRLQNWMDNFVQTIYTSRSRIFLKGENEPGVLHKVAKALAELRINITEAEGRARGDSNDPYVGFSMEIVFPLDRADISIQTVESTLRNMPFLNRAPGLNIISTEVRDNLSRDNSHRRETADSNYKVMTIKGNDRVGLIAAVTYPLYLRQINIINFNATSLNKDTNFFDIWFTLSKYPEQD